jgi:hypothetical protein
MASGGSYSEGSPIRDRDIATNYRRLTLKVIGIEDVRVVAGGNANAVDLGESSRAAFLQAFDGRFRKRRGGERDGHRPRRAGKEGRGDRMQERKSARQTRPGGQPHA